MNKQLCIINSPAGSSTLSLSRFKKKTVLAKWPTCKRRYQRNRKKGALSASAGIFYSREYVWKCNLTLIMASIWKSACTFSVFFYVIHLYTIESPRYCTHTSTCITVSISEFMQTIFSCKQVRCDCVLLLHVCVWDGPWKDDRTKYLLNDKGQLSTDNTCDFKQSHPTQFFLLFIFCFPPKIMTTVNIHDRVFSLSGSPMPHYSCNHVLHPKATSNFFFSKTAISPISGIVLSSLCSYFYFLSYSTLYWFHLALFIYFHGRFSLIYSLSFLRCIQLLLAAEKLSFPTEIISILPHLLIIKVQLSGYTILCPLLGFTVQWLGGFHLLPPKESGVPP